MAGHRYTCFITLLLLVDGALSWYGDDSWYRLGQRGRARRVFGYPRDWDIDWAASQRLALGVDSGTTESHRHRYNYQADQGSSGLHPQLIVLDKKKEDIRGLWHSQQRGSAFVVPGEEVRITPARGSSPKFYRGTITSTIKDGVSKQRNHEKHRHKNKGGRHQWKFSHDQPRTTPPRPRGQATSKSKACARCPSDRAVLANKGQTTVIMEVPPIIPCHPWSSVERVKQEILTGPQPGDDVPEGSHKVVIRLYRHKRTIANCVTRYNVIVRKCPQLELGPAMIADCPEGQTWGSACNVSCAPGYQLEGDNTTECGDDLEWSGPVSQCLQTTSCPVPVSPDHGHLSCRTPLHQPVPARAKGVLPDGSVCHFRCEPGFSVPPSQQGLTRVRCVGGRWDSDQDPTCVETNDLKEEEIGEEISAADALRFDGEGCPEDLCQNKGKCILILGQPMCSCMAGYSGPTCEDQEQDQDTDPDEFNSIT